MIRYTPEKIAALRPNGKRIRDAALLASFSSITFAAKKQKSQNNDSSRTI